MKVTYWFWQGTGWLVRPSSPRTENADQLSREHVRDTKRNHYFHWQNVLLTVLVSLTVLSVI